MRCPIFNHETADENNFCGYCGAKLIEYKKEKKNALVDQEGQPAVEPKENPPAGEINLFADPEEQSDPPPATQTAQPSFQNGAQTAPQSDYTFAFAPKKKSKFPIIAIIAVVLAAAVAALYFLGVFSSGPLVEFGKAAGKTARSKSFRMAIEMKAERQSLKMNGVTLFDPDARNIEIYMEASIADETVILLFKDNILLTDEAGYISVKDLSEYAEEFWKEYESDQEKVDWSDFLEIFGYGPDEVDYEEFDAAVETFILNLNDADYINEKFGSYHISKNSGTTSHIFEIKTRNLSKELVNVFSDAFRLNDEVEKTDAEDDVYDMLKEVLGTGVELEFSVKNGYLTGFRLEYAKAAIKATFSDFGEAEIDKGVIEKYKSHLANRPSF